MFKKGYIPWNKGKTNWMTPEHAQAIKASNTGRPAWNRGKKVMSPEAIKRAVEYFVAYRKGRPLSDEHKRKIGLGNKGKRAGKTWEEIFGIEQAAKIREINSAKMSGANHPFWGRTIPGEQKERQRQKLLGRFVGPKSPNWKGGVSWTYRHMVSRPEWLKIRKEIYARDRWCCQICGKHCGGKEIQCHHISPYRLSEDNSPENLITLCLPCHKKEEEALWRQDTFLVTDEPLGNSL